MRCARAKTHTQTPRNRIGYRSGAADSRRAQSAATLRRRIMTLLMRCLLGLLAVVVLALPTRAAEQVDLLLVLSSDVSRSIDHPKFLLQREGYTAAVANAQVLDAMKSGPNGKIALSFIDWMVIDGPGSARKFGDQLAELPRSFADRTSIAGGIDYSAAHLARAPFEAPRKTIDVSGDGTNNAGRDVKLARDEALAKN